MSETSQSVLIVDDDAGLMRLMQRKLQQEGYRVDTAVDGRAGLEQCQRNHYDVVLLDHEMPGYSGLDLLRTLRKEYKNDPGFAVVMVTGNGNEKLAVEALKNGADDYVVKDVDAAYLEMMPRIIDHVIYHRQALAVQRDARRFARMQRQLITELSAVSDVVTAAGILLEHAMSISGMDSGGVYMAEDDCLRLITHTGLGKAFLDKVDRIDKSHAMVQHVFSGKNFNALGEALDTLSHADVARAEGLYGVLVFPVLHEGQVVGCFNLAAHRPVEVPALTMQTLETMAGQIGSTFARLRAQDELRKMEAQYRIMVEHTREAVLIIQHQSILYANPMAEELSGYTAEELRGMPFEQFVHPEDQATVANYHRQRMAGESVPEQYAFRFIARDGKERWVEIKAVRVMWDAGPAVLVQGADITQRFRQEAERQAVAETLQHRVELEKRISLLSTYFLTLQAEDVNEGINLALHSVGRFAQVDACYVCMFDDDLRHMSIAHEWVADEDFSGKEKIRGVVATELPWCMEQFKRGQTVHIPEINNLPDDAAVDRKRLRFMGYQSLLAVPLHDGVLLRGWLGFAMFEQRKAWTEEDIRLLVVLGRILLNAIKRREYEQMLRESEARYRRSAIELRARNEEIKNYVSVISHDLRAPLSNIQGFMAELNYDFSALREPVSEWLEQSGNERAGAWKTTWDERIPESIGLIETSVNQMNRRIEALLELARMGRQSIKIMPVDMTRLVKECIRTMAYQAEEKNVKVTCDDLPSVMSDAGIIEQVVGNLLDNAVKYLDPSREGMVHISGQRTPVECRYWIKDNGRGIPRDQCERIFDLFHRAGHRDVKGEGIGLASVRALMHRLGGQIWCESDTGKGAVFVFTLPNVENRDTEKEDNAGV